MRHLVTVLILVMATGLTQARQGGDRRPDTPKVPPKSSVTPDKLLWPQGDHEKARGNIIPDICSGC